MKSCVSCGGPFESKAKHAKYCSDTCRKRAQRGHRATTSTSPAEPAPLSSTLVDATRQQLENAGRLDTWLGQQALALAAILASGRGTPAGLSATSRELRETMTAALRGANATTSAVMRHRDELAARRARAGA